MEVNKAKLEVGPTINDLPNEILLKIFEFLPQSEHYAVGLISKRFRDLIDNSIWCETIPALEITEENVRKVKEAIEMKNNKFCFKSVKINEVTNIAALEYILKSIGEEIENLSMVETAAFHLLKDNVIHLKSLEIDFDFDLEINVNDKSFDLCFFPRMENLSFLYNYGLNSTTKKLLEQLKSAKKSSSLKHFESICNKITENYLIETLLHHADTLESLELNYDDDDDYDDDDYDDDDDDDNDDHDDDYDDDDDNDDHDDDNYNDDDDDDHDDDDDNYNDDDDDDNNDDDDDDNDHDDDDDNYNDDDDSINIKNWHTPFLLMKNLNKLCLTGFQSKELTNIFNVLPKETPLEHLELEAWNDFEVLPLIIAKFMNSLKYLELSNFMKLTDFDAMEFGKLHKLRVLKLINCQKITNLGLLAGIAKKQNIFLDELHLENIPNLDEVGLGVVVSRFTNLRVLTLNNMEKAITNTSLASIGRFSTRLRSLSIDCSNITDEGLIEFGNEAYSINRLRILVKLTLENCESLTDRTLIDGLNLRALRSLDLDECPKITRKGIESLMKSCPLLEFLSIPSTIIINDDVINDDVLFVIGNGLKHLRKLNITGGYKLTIFVRDNIKAIFTALQNSTTFSTDCKLEI